MNWKKENYEVGYGKPPVEGRFRKGKSGNPKGRPKNTRNFKTDLEEVLDAKVTVTESGKPKKVSSQKAALLRLREQALAGNPRALDKLLDLAREAGEAREAAQGERTLKAYEADILDRYFFGVYAPSVHGKTAPVPEESDDE